MTDNILVIGGTGKTGRKIVESLKSQNINVRVGSRSASPGFDWKDESTWDSALKGMNKLYITFQPDLAVPGALEAIENLAYLAKREGIQKVVLLSGRGEKEAELCEQVIIHSGINYTILRCSWFNQNFSESFFLDPIVAGYVALPKPEAKVPYIDTDDIAEAAVEALLNRAHSNKLYELTGPRQLTFKEVVNEISMATGREIQFTPVPLEAYIQILNENGVPDEYVWLIDYLFTHVLDAPGNNVISHDIEKILGRKAKDFSAFAQETASTGVWNNREKQEVMN